MWELVIIQGVSGEEAVKMMADRPVNRKNLYFSKKVAEADANYLQAQYGGTAWVGIREVKELKGGI